MNTAPINDKISRYKAAPSIRFADEIIEDMKGWIEVMEQYASDIDEEKFKSEFLHFEKDELIETLVKLLVITGNSDKLTVMRILEKGKLRKAVDFLFKLDDRANHRNIYAIATLLDLAEAEGKSIRTLVELVQYARTGK